MLAFFAALLAAVPSASPAPPAAAAPEPPTATAEVPPLNSAEERKAEILEAASPWWERITVTVDGKGTQQSCRYETSAAGSTACDAAMAASIRSGGKGTSGLFRKVTFERRFSPGGRPDAAPMAPGDTLLGRQVMYLTIDAKGAIETCKVIAVSGDAAPDYGCDEVKKERFSIADGGAAASRQAFMTVMAYGHTEAIA